MVRFFIFPLQIYTLKLKHCSSVLIIEQTTLTQTTIKTFIRIIENIIIIYYVFKHLRGLRLV